MELMNNPDEKEHEQLNQLYKEDEPDRFKGVVKDRAPALNMSRRAPSPVVVKQLDQDIIDELKRLLLKEQKGLTDEKEKLENLMNNNPRELEQAEKELDNQKDNKKDGDYTAETRSGSDTDSDSDTSIQSEY